MDMVLLIQKCQVKKNRILQGGDISQIHILVWSGQDLFKCSAGWWADNSASMLPN